VDLFSLLSPEAPVRHVFRRSSLAHLLPASLDRCLKAHRQDHHGRYIPCPASSRCGTVHPSLRRWRRVVDATKHPAPPGRERGSSGYATPSGRAGWRYPASVGAGAGISPGLALGLRRARRSSSRTLSNRSTPWPPPRGGAVPRCRRLGRKAQHGYGHAPWPGTSHGRRRTEGLRD